MQFLIFIFTEWKWLLFFITVYIALHLQRKYKKKHSLIVKQEANEESSGSSENIEEHSAEENSFMQNYKNYINERNSKNFSDEETSFSKNKRCLKLEEKKSKGQKTRKKALSKSENFDIDINEGQRQELKNDSVICNIAHLNKEEGSSYQIQAIQVYQSKCLLDNFRKIKFLVEKSEERIDPKMQKVKEPNCNPKRKILNLFENYYVKEQTQQLNKELNFKLKNLFSFHDFLLALNKFVELKEENLLISAENLGNFIKIFLNNKLFEWVALFLKESYKKKIFVSKAILDDALCFLSEYKSFETNFSQNPFEKTPHYTIIQGYNNHFCMPDYRYFFNNQSMFVKKRLNVNSLEFWCSI